MAHFSFHCPHIINMLSEVLSTPKQRPPENTEGHISIKSLWHPSHIFMFIPACRGYKSNRRSRLTQHYWPTTNQKWRFLFIGQHCCPSPIRRFMSHHRLTIRETKVQINYVGTRKVLQQHGLDNRWPTALWNWDRLGDNWYVQ